MNQITAPLVMQMVTHHLEQGLENGEGNSRILQAWFQLAIKAQIILPGQLTKLGKNFVPTLIPMQDLCTGNGTWSTEQQTRVTVIKKVIFWN